MRGGQLLIREEFTIKVNPNSAALEASEKHKKIMNSNTIINQILKNLL